MFQSDALSINHSNHLTIGGCDTVALAQQYGTPLYVMDEDLIRANCRLYKHAMDTYYDGHGQILYASKAFSTLYIYRLVQEEGLGADVVSAGELYTALKAGFPAERIYFHGNNKTDEELTMAVERGVGRIVVDNAYELSRLDTIAGRAGKVVDIAFRVKPGIDAHTHQAIMTGQIDSKFGVALETGEAMDIVRRAHGMAHVRVVGLHCHIGSQIFDLSPFQEAARVMMHFIGDIKDALGLEINELNLGGGYGIQYLPSDNPVPYDQYIEAVSKVVKATAAERGLTLPRILMEPGRSITAPAGITLYTVGGVKEIPDVRTYVSVDGGMADKPRYILYQSAYSFVLANKAGDAPTKTVTVAGKCCESGDLLGEGVSLPQVEPGDTLAVLATGAYNYAMASNYNRIPRPPVVMVSGGQSCLIVRRESLDDLIQNDLLE